MHSRCADGWAIARSVKSWETVKYSSGYDASHGLQYCYFTVGFVDLSQLGRLIVLVCFASYLREEAFYVVRTAQVVFREMVRRFFHKRQCANAAILSIARHPFKEVPIETFNASFRHVRT